VETIPHRELRNHSSEILARVSKGESIAVTNHGELAAILSPPSMSALDRARQSGEVSGAAAHGRQVRRCAPCIGGSLHPGHPGRPPRRPVIRYLDTSAALKLVIEAPESARLAAHLDSVDAADELVSVGISVDAPK
jgi:prevent-host-death family protein